MTRSLFLVVLHGAYTVVSLLQICAWAPIHPFSASFPLSTTTMDMSPWSTALFVVVVVIACVAVFLSCGPGGDDDERRNRSRSTPLPTSRTRLLHPSTQPDPYSRGQTNGRPPATHNYHHHFHRPSSTSARATPPNLNPQLPSSTSFIQPVAGTQESSASQNNSHYAPRAGAISSYAWASHGAPKPAPTDPSHPAPRSSIHIDKNTARATATAGYDYGNSFHRANLASHHVGESGQIPSTANHAQDSYHQWPTRSHVAEATIKTKSHPTTTDHEGHGLRSGITAPHSSESRATLEISACTDIFHPPPQLTSSHVSTTMAGITNDVDPPRVSPPFFEESSLSGLVSSRIPTQPSTRTSSSGRLDISSSSRIVPHSPIPVSGTQYGGEVEAVASAQEMKAARELRERGRRCKREMHAARDLAKSARKSGDYKAEQRHKHDAMAYESQMKDLDKRAAKIIFRENNKVRGHPSRYKSRAQPLSCQVQKEGTVDLHGLYVPEALEYAKKELQSATYRDDGKVCFIVGTSFWRASYYMRLMRYAWVPLPGRGLHSDGGQSKLRPRLQELCDEYVDILRGVPCLAHSC